MVQLIGKPMDWFLRHPSSLLLESSFGLLDLVASNPHCCG